MNPLCRPLTPFLLLLLLFLFLCFNTLVLALSQAPLQSSPSISSTEFTTFRSPDNPSHSLRITSQNSTLCDARSRHYTGWLDVGSRHLFFWFFESQRDPVNDPLTVWLNGGPGGSSMLGLFQELGPCLISPTGNLTTYHNKYGWSTSTSLLFIDQPAGVGFSYILPEGSVPDSSLATAVDIHIFLQIFISQVFPYLLKVPLHIAGESYAGHYIPALASQIQTQNKLYPSHIPIPLSSILIGNGYISPLDITWGYWPTLCTTNPGVPEPIFNSTRCDIMATHLPRCLSLSRICYAHPDPAICNAAQTICVTGVIDNYDGESGAGGRNRFDITAPCIIDRFCYPTTDRIEEYLNLPRVQAALRITEDMPAYGSNYSVASETVEMAFQVTGDVGISMEAQVRALLESQIDVLLYQGNLDLACNTAGNLRWAEGMSWKGQAEFASKRLMPWGEGEEKSKPAGTMKEVNIKMGRDDDERKTRFAFVTVDGSGHMVPQDRPRVALDLFERWLDKRPFN